MKIIKLILSLTIIAAVCAGVLASVNAVTKETIKGIRAQQTLDAAAAVMPPSVDATKVESLAEGVDYRVVGQLDNTETIMNDSLWIGLYPGMGEARLEYMIKSIREFCGK